MQQHQPRCAAVMARRAPGPRTKPVRPGSNKMCNDPNRACVYARDGGEQQGMGDCAPSIVKGKRPRAGTQQMVSRWMRRGGG